MAVQRVSLSAVGVSAPIPLPMKGYIYAGSGVSLLLNFSGGGPAVANATVEVSSDPNAINAPASAKWNAHDTLAGKSADANSSIVYPLAAVRLRLTTWSSGTVSLDVGLPDYTL